MLQVLAPHIGATLPLPGLPAPVKMLDLHGLRYKDVAGFSSDEDGVGAREGASPVNDHSGRGTQPMDPIG